MTNADKLKPCRYCGASMKFIQTIRGGWMPVDPELINSDDCEDGDVFVTDDGRVIKVNHGIAGNETFEGYVSHFATCPQADLARRQKENVKKRKKV